MLISDSLYFILHLSRDFHCKSCLPSLKTQMQACSCWHLLSSKAQNFSSKTGLTLSSSLQTSVVKLVCFLNWTWVSVPKEFLKKQSLQKRKEKEKRCIIQNFYSWSYYITMPLWFYCVIRSAGLSLPHLIRSVSGALMIGFFVSFSYICKNTSVILLQRQVY